MDKATIENLNWLPEDTSKTRRIKVILPQCYAALAIFAVNFSYLIFVPTMLDVAYFIDDTKSTPYRWYNTMTVLGLLLGGIVAQIAGARAIIMLTGATSVIAWITLIWISPYAVQQWMYFIVSLAQGMMQAPFYVYLAEISQPNMRSALMSTIFVSANISWVYLYLIGMESVQINALVIIAFALFGVVVMFFLPDSPYWLANKGSYHEVETSLAWFRGRTIPENVKSESKAIISNVQNSPTASKVFRQKSLYNAALIVGYVYLVSAFVKSFYLAYYSIMQYRQIALLTHKISLVFEFSIVFASIAFVVLVAIIGKRKMFLISLFVASIAILVASFAVYLCESQILSEDAHSWFFLICPGIAKLSLYTGVASAPLLLNGELFPSELRYFGAGFMLFLMHISSDDLYIHELLHTPIAVFILAIASMIGFISLLRLFPRNDNRSLVEIE